MDETSDKSGAVWAIVAAAGSGSRFGAGMPKQFVPIDGVPLLHRTLRALRACAELDGLVVVLPPDRVAAPEALPEEFAGLDNLRRVAGAAQRTDSVRAGLEALPPDCRLVLVHDGARPVIPPALVERVLEGARRHGACVPAQPILETVKEVVPDGRVLRTLDRVNLRTIQTPQGFRREVLEEAYRWRRCQAGPPSFPDDAALVEASGHPVATVPGEEGNLKITTPSDLGRLGLAAPRVGFGHDVHRLVPGRRLVLGGVEIPFERGLDGHSDADAVLHALADALLGAAGLPDIGVQFPNTDPRFLGADSAALLREVVKLVQAVGLRPSSVDLTILAERPKLSSHLPAMAGRIAGALGIPPAAVGIKAGTGEGLGFVGREEGIAAYAVAVLVAKLD